ncbi:MAG: polymer-forming cytoskeletal protein [Vicinamibacterales bacterium]
MVRASRQHVRAVLRTAVILAAISAVVSLQAAGQAPAAEDRQALRRAVEARFEVVPLTHGIALAGTADERRVEISAGVVYARGMPLSGAELRRRFGADADLVLRLSYLNDTDLRQLFTPAPAVPPAPAPPDAPPAPTPPVVAPPAAAVSAPEAPAPPPAPPAPTERVMRRSGARIALAKRIVVAADEDVRDGVFSLGGPVRIDGRVRDEVVVIGANVDLGPTADVRGDITVVGGELVMAPGARHVGDVHHAMGGDWPRWSWPSVRWTWFDPAGSARWFSLGATVLRVGMLALAVLLVTVVAGGRVTRVGAAAAAAPIRAGLIGVAAQVLFVPALVLLAVLLAVTIVGLPFIAVVLPLAVLALFLAMLLGFTGLAERLGRSLGARYAWAAHPTVGAALLGTLVIVLPTLASRLIGIAPDLLHPIVWALLAVGALVEYVAWTVGLGAALLTGLGRSAIVPPPVPPTADGPMGAPAAL